MPTPINALPINAVKREFERAKTTAPTIPRLERNNISLLAPKTSIAAPHWDLNQGKCIEKNRA